VSIIIPSGGDAGVLKRNLDSLADKTEYPDYEIVIIDNCRHGDVKRFVEKWKKNGRQPRYIDWRNRPFNYAAINNHAARQCSSPLLLFLNDDTEVIAPDWLRAMVELGLRSEIGAVGARLLYPNGLIQHAGVVLGLFNNCGHAFRGLAGDRPHYFTLPDVIREVSAVTAACLLMRSSLFYELGGFDEEQFPISFNDVDLCLRIRGNGYRILYTPHAVLFHHESYSKTSADLVPTSPEVQAMQTKWKEVIDADPFYNPNLTRTAEDYSYRRKA
jgi:GT2 family glycosyltransferase